MYRRVAVASTHIVKLPFCASAASCQIAGATTRLRQACDTILTQSKELENITQLEMYLKSLIDSVTFSKASEQSIRSTSATATTESTRLGQLFDSTRAEMVDLQSKLAARDAVLVPWLKICARRLGHLSAA